MKHPWYRTPLGVTLLAGAFLQGGLAVSQDQIEELSNAATFWLSGWVLVAGAMFLGVFFASWSEGAP